MPEKTDEQLAAEVAHLEEHLPQVKPELMRFPGVLDVYVGIKTVEGRGTDTACFIVEVEEKKSRGELTPAERIPESIEGHPIDVFERIDSVLESEVYFGGSSLEGGTLGIFALATAANAHLTTDTPVMVTNHHVASRIGRAVGIGSSACDCYCSHCCEDGIIVDSRRDASVDVAIAKLSDETRFTHEIFEIGAVQGSAPPTAGMRVSKYGDKTKLTHGRIHAIVPSMPIQDHEGNTHNMTNQLRIVPAGPTADVSEGGDSGSVYVQDSTRKVVGLHHSGGGNHANASQIPAVLSAMNIMIPIMGTAGSIPLSAAAAMPRTLTPARARFGALERRLRGTGTGSRWLEMIERHVAEVRDLVNHDRRTKVVWRRMHGPAFFAHWMNSAREPDYTVPREIVGTRIENTLLAMAATLRERGSRELADDVAAHYLTILELVRGVDRASDFVERVCAHAARLEERHGE